MLLLKRSRDVLIEVLMSNYLAQEAMSDTKSIGKLDKIN